LSSLWKQISLEESRRAAYKGPLLRFFEAILLAMRLDALLQMAVGVFLGQTMPGGSPEGAKRDERLYEINWILNWMIN